MFIAWVSQFTRSLVEYTVCDQECPSRSHNPVRHRAYPSHRYLRRHWWALLSFVMCLELATARVPKFEGGRDRTVRGNFKLVGEDRA